jgi:DNA processing protein
MGEVTMSARLLAGAEYPARLRELDSPPPNVFVVGELPYLYAVAIVGTRRPSGASEKFAEELAEGLAAEGVAVFSGGAKGIDTAVHRGALKGGGVTVVVAPSSFDCPYPKENAELFRQIVEARGAFLTTHPPGTTAAPHHFFPRNRLLVALADALVIVETGFRGGSRNAARYARELGKPVLVVPHGPWESGCNGYLLELELGARAITKVDDVLAAVGRVRRPLDAAPGDAQVASPPPNRERQPTLPGLVPGMQKGCRPMGLTLTDGPEEENLDRKGVVELLALGPLWPDEICRKLGLPAQRVTGLLLTLTLESVVVSEPSGRVALVNC